MPQKIVVKGTSGAGKSTFAAKLGQRLDLPWIELDALHHGPNWSEPTAEEFRDRIRQILELHPAGWVIDGNYDSKLGDLVVGQAETIVWLDLSFPLKFFRLLRRTVHRVLHKEELWNGNRETWRNSFASRDSVLLWMIRAHRRHRREWPGRYGDDARLVRLRTPAEMRRWLNQQAVADEANRVLDGQER